MISNLHIMHKEKKRQRQMQSLNTSLASGVSMHRCDATGAETINQLMRKTVTGDLLSFCFVEGGAFFSSRLRV